MGAGSLSCPRCGGVKLQERGSGERLPWLWLQDRSTRRLLGGGLVAGGVLVIGAGVFFAFVGVAADMGVWPLLFAVLWALVLARIGVYLIAAGVGGLRAGSLTDLACLRCGTAWRVGEESAADDGTAGPPAPAAPTATGAPAVVPAQRTGETVRVTSPPGVAEWELFVRASAQNRPADDRASQELEDQRIDRVRLIADAARTERAAGRRGHEALAALLRLLDVETGHRPILQVGHARRTLRHEVVSQLGQLGDPAAVGPLSDLLTRAQQDYADIAAEMSGTTRVEGRRRDLRDAAVAENVYETTAEALALLADPAALPALEAALPDVHFGMRKATVRAIKAIKAAHPTPAT